MCDDRFLEGCLPKQSEVIDQVLLYPSSKFGRPLIEMLIHIENFCGVSGLTRHREGIEEFS